jgi:hypothetical protein
MSLLHKANALLPEQEKDGVVVDDNANHDDTLTALETLNAQGDIVDHVLLGRCLRLLSARRTMKYRHDVGLATRALEVLYSVYINKRLSIPMRIRLLSGLTQLCKKKNGYEPIKLAARFDWSV